MDIDVDGGDDDDNEDNARFVTTTRCMYEKCPIVHQFLFCLLPNGHLHLPDQSDNNAVLCGKGKDELCSDLILKF